MGSGGGGGGDRDGGAAQRAAAQRAELERQQKARAAQARFASRAQDERLGIKDTPPAPAATLATEKKREVGVKYTPTSTPDGGVRTEATIMKTGPSGELARKPGVSPGDVMATVGTLPTVSADVAAANIAGRPDLSVASLGDLARRARVGSDLTPIPTPGSVGLGAIGRMSAMDTLTKLASDPSAKVVQDVRGGIAGVETEGPISGSKVYSGKTQPTPTVEPKDDITPLSEEPQVAVAEEAVAPTLMASAGRGRSTRFKRTGADTILTGKGALYTSRFG